MNGVDNNGAFSFMHNTRFCRVATDGPVGLNFVIFNLEFQFRLSVSNQIPPSYKVNTHNSSP
jgi:hypothetical protein